MTRRPGLVLRLFAVVALIACAAPGVGAYVTFGSSWIPGAITVHLQLHDGPVLADGSPSYNAAAAAALGTWNEHLGWVRFVALESAPRRGTDGDLVNQVFFDTSYYGTSFERDTLAVTTRWTFADTDRVEADVVFNSAFQWDSYRGDLRPGTWDIRRLALHEFGHALGLDHPDRNGQSVRALMNSDITHLDSLTADDIAGAQSLYGSNAPSVASVASNVSFPPRDEPAAFFAHLTVLYANELRAAPSLTHVDPEGAVIWLTEYTRQRAGQCGHEAASANTLNQITGNGSALVCASTPAGAIAFPPRNEGLQFMTELDNAYRGFLRRPPALSFVDNEGAVVWVLEYLRYRLNGCTHGDAQSKVLSQIRTGIIAPMCAA